MKDKDLQFDHTCHVLYSKPCKKQIKEKIALHYEIAKREAVWEKVQKQYVDYLSTWRTDLGGKKNFHNCTCGTYDCIALISYYKVCKEVTNLEEIEQMINSMLLPKFRKLGHFVDCNKPFFKKLMYRAFQNAKKRCDKWGDYDMRIAPYDKERPIYYEFTSCPVAEFAKQNNIVEVMPALCNGDFDAMALIHARLVRTTTCSNGCKCDYTICGDKDEYVKEHPEYKDEAGYKRNK